MARGQTPPRGKKPIDDSDDVGSTGEATHVSQLFRYEDGCHTFFPGNLNTVFAMENEQYGQMTSLAKPLKVGAKNWGFRNALLALDHGVTVPAIQVAFALPTFYAYLLTSMMFTGTALLFSGLLTTIS